MGAPACWCLWFHPRHGAGDPEEDDARARKQRLVEQGRAHAALVFDGDVAVGWCLRGRRLHVPTPEGRRQLRHDDDGAPALIGGNLGLRRGVRSTVPADDEAPHEGADGLTGGTGELDPPALDRAVHPIDHDPGRVVGKLAVPVAACAGGVHAVRHEDHRHAVVDELAAVPHVLPRGRRALLQHDRGVGDARRGGRGPPSPRPRSTRRRSRHRRARRLPTDGGRAHARPSRRASAARPVRPAWPGQPSTTIAAGPDGGRGPRRARWSAASASRTDPPAARTIRARGRTAAACHNPSLGWTVRCRAPTSPTSSATTCTPATPPARCPTPPTRPTVRSRTTVGHRRSRPASTPTSSMRWCTPRARCWWWPVPGRARPACSPTASPTSSSRGRSRRASWPSRSRTRQRPRCANGSPTWSGRW